MDTKLLDWFSYISMAFSMLSLLVGLFCIKTIKRFLIPLFLLVFISAFVEIINLIVEVTAINNSTINNLPILHIYTGIEFSLIFIFYMLFYKQYYKLKILYLLLPLFYVVTYIDYKVNGLNEMDSFSVTVESTFFIVLSLLSFFFIIRHLIFENILNMPFFWINSGILIYFSGNILLFIFSNSFDKSEMKTFSMLWFTIHSLLNIIYNSLICIGFWKSRIK